MAAIKRAAIYIRVSSEHQAEKASPRAQEEDARAYCQERGYTITTVYRDIDRYRVGRRLVEPSGTRADRPGLRQMLADAAAGRFDVIVAWREDRLYRGLRPMLDVIEMIETHPVTVELVRETFDRKMAPIKASIARMELDAKRDRTEMGVAARLAAGRPWPAALPLGYAIEGDHIVIDPETAVWVQKIFAWAAEDVATREIRRRLVAGGARQRFQNLNRQRAPWGLSTLYQILHNPVYHTGIQRHIRGDQIFELVYPPIVSTDVAEQALKRIERNRSRHVRHVHQPYLVAGLVICEACQNVMSAATYTAQSHGRPRLVSTYRCGLSVHGYPEPGCAGQISVRKLDQAVWGLVWDFLRGAGLENAVRERIEGSRRKRAGAQTEIQRLKKDLQNVTSERQWVITQARKQVISEVDLELQLNDLTLQERDLRRELNDVESAIDEDPERLLEWARALQTRLEEGARVVTDPPQTPAQAELQFRYRKKIVDRVVKRVTMHPDRSITVDIVLGAESDDGAISSPLGSVDPLSQIYSRPLS